MSSDPRSVAFNDKAPEAERFEAMSSLQQTYLPTASELIPRDEIQAVIDHINQGLEDAAIMAKGMSVPFPGRADPVPSSGPRAVMLDTLQTTNLGDYYDKNSAMNFEPLRDLVLRTPLLSMIVQTRVRQVARFCQPSEDGGLGFTIAHEDPHQTLEGEDAEAGKQLRKFFKNCGWEFNPRKRKLLGRDTLTQFMAKSVWDSMALDSAPIETEMKRGRDLGMDGFYAVDGSTIRLCTDQGYDGDDKVFALQVNQGRIACSFTHDQLIYEVRNPRSDVRCAGYGMAEPELMVRIITGWLNALTYNSNGFDMNSIPKGLLHLSGDYGPQDLVSFKRQWGQMTKGISNSWNLPVLISKDQESKASFEKFGVEFNEMAFSKWMTFLTSVACSLYSISPEEINFDSFSSQSSQLGGTDPETKIEESKDKGLRPLLSYYEAMFTDYVVSSFSDHLCFRFVGLDAQDPKQKWEEDKTAMTWGELRKRRGDPPLEDKTFESLPLNPSFIGPWQAKMQAEQQAQMQAQQPGPDYGEEGAGDGGGDFGGGGDGEEAPPEAGQDETADAAAQGAAIEDDPTGGGGGEDFGKALDGLAYRLGEWNAPA